ncbi:uncharacterized protein BDZ99DRAFT_120386 [Mytilinidion resinicola]|uniref:Ankyrin n=1 Tax=Mytilinidion resinicola TaxID=574789 RepID=A0A6A6Z5W9_9PEZI|nr:uncharacterized protein BDZ99DRAFT_120386 [Mytilinidion resinicola]KAF2815657.1 hypothetical protein BDZ99DRAFT_120386 [Mytilinidion resinicola]
MLLSLRGDNPIGDDLYLRAMYDTRVFQLLLQCRADVNSYTRNAPPLLHRVLELRRRIRIDHSNDNIIVRILLDAGADMDRLWIRCHSDGTPHRASLPLALAAAGVDLDLVTMLIEAGADVNGHEPMSRRSYTRPLIHLVENPNLSFGRQFQVICKLLELGADPNVRAIHYHGRRPALLDIVLMIGLLIDHGADLEQLDHHGRNFAQRHPPNGFLWGIDNVLEERRSPRILMKVALDRKLPGLLPVKYILPKTEAALHKLQTTPETRENKAAVTEAGKELKDCWGLCRSIYDTFTLDQLPVELRCFWGENHDHIERLLASLTD